MQRAFTEKETRVFSQRAGASQFDDFIMTAARNLAQNQNYYWGEVNEGKKWCPIFQQKYVYLDGMKSVILLK